MFDQGRYKWAFLFFFTNIFALTPVFANQPRTENKEKTNFKTKDFVWDITDLSEEFLQKTMEKAIKKLNGKLAPFKWLKCPVKGYLASCGNRVYYLDGKKAVEIPVKKSESYEKITEKIYCACGISAEKTVFGMLNKKEKPDTVRTELIKKIFEKNNLKKGEEGNKKKKEEEKNKEEAKNTDKAGQKKNRFAPKITVSKVKKNTLDMDGKEIECFTCTKHTVRGAIKKRLIKKNQESVFGFMFKNKKDKWIYYMELFGGKKGDLITEDGWKTKYGTFIKKHDCDVSLKEKTLWRTKGDVDDTDSKKSKNRTDLLDYCLKNPLEKDPLAKDQNHSFDQSLLKSAKFDEI
jgi:hypothetical protein